VGHRGNPAAYPDNSIDGILHARSVADMVEIDVRATADGVLVLSHDPSTDGRIVIEHAADDLPDLARFERLLELVGTFPLNIEIKNSPQDPDFDPTFDTAMRIADRARPGDLVTCFHWPTVDAIRGAYPDLATGLLVDRGWDLDGALVAASERGHRAIAPHWTLVTDPASIMTAAGDVAINVWTVNDDDLARRLIHGGVSGIITDDPARMRQLVEEADI